MPVERRALDLEVQTEPAGATHVVLRGTLDVGTVGAARRELVTKLSGPHVGPLSVDAAALTVGTARMAPQAARR